MIFGVSFFLIVYVYFLYPLVAKLFTFFIKRKVIKDYSGNYLPSVSLIMAAYNEEKHIEAKIKNCLSLDYPKDKLEIIIGSDGSDDRTNEIANKYAEREIRFFPYSQRRGKMAVINDNVSKAKGELLVFSDIYERFEVDAIKKLIRNFFDPTVGAVTGNHISNPSDTEIGRGTLLYWRYQRWLQRVESQLYSILSCDGTIYACRRNLYVAPPAGTINDDKAVPLGVIKQGYRVVFEPEAIARGDLIDDAKSFFKQKIRGQAGMYQIFWLFKDMFIPRKPFVLWFIFMSHGVGPVMVPWLLLVLLLANIGLYSTFPYNYILFLQLLFYGSSVIGAVTNRLGIRIPFLYLSYFFVISNLASLVGCWAFVFKLQKAAWQKVS